ncbi:MAG: SDR family oxidoreductase [SAR202 cluster bacterium]|jgi:short-subunit dehydrogenase|nr:SDR family oxidoreductase [SAR202 cluster bacterium]MDP6300994.1 SDR family oxidoreductase [SAR202 cluster bacterium]MDP7290785.1 SDR family oxidoreductase [Verrucomicrobiota bacterium]HJO81308.1 SDR family oxidoreductase [SAR202 cluster bacterium]|tara:strand:- start:107 stop:955 length:849 start_codon:yes stop_codon:yes gene_type:complete
MAANHKTGTVLITGASSGIGRATCLYLAQRGYTVIGTSRVASRLDGLREDARNSEVVVHGVEVDINSDSEVERAMPEVISEHGIIDALVNNAGYGLWGPVESLSIDELRAQFETNVFAAVRMTKAVLPGMLAQRRGKIVNVSSVLGRLATPFNGAYASSKFALEGLSESMRTELWPFGVHVSVVEPGLFETDFQANQVKAERSQDPALAYSAYVQRYNSRHRRYEKLSSDPVKVSKVIHKIIRSRRPGFRYPVSIEARAGILGARFLPERLFRWLLSRATMR